MSTINSSMDKYSSWCTVEVEGGKRIKVRLAHVGRGRFLVLEDDEGGKYTDKKVDASDIVNCLR
jgi:hypothetical protein